MPWTIARKPIAVPTAKAGLVYNGAVQIGVATGEGFALAGTTSAVNAGSYTASAIPDANHVWADGTAVSKPIPWSIARKAVTPTVTLSPTKYSFNKTVRTPNVTLKANGKTLDPSQYTIAWATGRTNVGSYKATIALQGNYSGASEAAFKIEKATNPAIVRAKAKTVSRSKLKKKAVTVASMSVTKAQGKVAYKKVAKGSSKKFTVNKKTGKITVKKGTAKGTYFVKVKVTVKGNANYKSLTKIVKAKVTVK